MGISAADGRREMKIKAGKEILRRADKAVAEGKYKAFVIYTLEGDLDVIDHIRFIPNDP